MSLFIGLTDGTTLTLEFKPQGILNLYESPKEGGGKRLLISHQGTPTYRIGHRLQVSRIEVHNAEMCTGECVLVWESIHKIKYIF